jgi:hypothetical protein
MLIKLKNILITHSRDGYALAAISMNDIMLF